MTVTSSESYTVVYTYGRFSNRVQMVVTGSENYTTTYTYDANNRLLTEVKTAAAATDTTDYYYDPNGNMIAKTTSTVSDGTETETLSLAEGVAESWLYRYNGFNQLTGLSTDSLEESYAYVPSGLRVSKTTNGTQTSYVLDGDQVVRESVSGTTTAVYIRGINLIYSTIGSDTNYYLYNGHGDVVQLANTLGIATKEYDYDAFGNEKNPNSADTNPFRYCGEYLDLSSGAYYLRARYYDPAVGRFLSEDSVRFTIYTMPNRQESIDPLSLNLYTYCHNNPIQYIDPSGHEAITISTTSAIIAGMALMGAAILGYYLASPEGQAAIGQMYSAIADTADGISAYLSDQDKARALVIDYVNSIIESGNQPKYSNNSVYVLVDNNNEVRYVGRTNDPARRSKEHKAWYSSKKNYNMVVIMSGLDKKTAMATEQILISAFTLEALNNARREIAAFRVDQFENELSRAVEIMYGSPTTSFSTTLEDIQDLFKY